MMVTKLQIKQAIKNGSDQADKVINFRNSELKKRATAINAKSKKLQPQAFTLKYQANFVKTLGPKSSETLVAEGDSWFDYPKHDILRLLEDHHGYEVESVASKGDRVEDMAYDVGQHEELTRLFEKLLRNGTTPRAILLSGGGNDIAGDEFGMLLNHKESPVASLNMKVVDGVINERIKISYITILSRITNICLKRFNHVIPILVHGYDYPVPDGRGFLGGWWFLPGPWLDPGFREKGFDMNCLPERIKIIKTLIDIFNEMLIEVTSLSEFKHVHYVPLRETLSNPDYTNDWANEMPPTEEGFDLVTNKFAEVISNLP
jgi:hypothetical protein